jgi:hypothetical protein
MKMNFRRTNVLKINFATTHVAFGKEQHGIAWQYTNHLVSCCNPLFSWMLSVDVKPCEMMGLQIWNLDVPNEHYFLNSNWTNAKL